MAFLAFAVDVVFLMLLNTAVSHQSGSIAKLSTSLLLNPSVIFTLLVSLGGFAMGAVLSGYFIHHPQLSIRKPYGRAITAIAFALCLSYYFFEHGAPQSSIFIAGLCCGFQNALATSYKGLVLRTTHITGLITDLGVHFGMLLKGHPIEAWKFGVPFLIIVASFGGGLFGTILFVSYGQTAIYLLALCYGILGITWMILRNYFLHMVDIKNNTLV
jgi:uncharacterized membrane protein YoaK (UPF0700 family)